LARLNERGLFDREGEEEIQRYAANYSYGIIDELLTEFSRKFPESYSGYEETTRNISCLNEIQQSISHYKSKGSGQRGILHGILWDEETIRDELQYAEEIKDHPSIRVSRRGRGEEYGEPVVKNTKWKEEVRKERTDGIEEGGYQRGN